MFFSFQDESMLYNWYHPHQMFTPIACFPKGFPIGETAITALEEKPVKFQSATTP